MSGVNPAVEKYGWTAVPRKMSLLLEMSEACGPPPVVAVDDMSIPDTKLAKAVHEYAKEQLAIETYNHSMRVFFYGQAMVHHAFPSWASPAFQETYFLACLLHDIGTTDKNIVATLMSFEFYGGLIVLDLLRKLHAPIEQAENVAETVIRHQDLGDTGTLTRLAGLIQLATIFDNMGKNDVLVARGTIENVVGAYPRIKWSGCFARTIRKENGLKPWAHTTHLGERDFPEGVENNELMKPYDG